MLVLTPTRGVGVRLATTRPSSRLRGRTFSQRVRRFPKLTAKARTNASSDAAKAPTANVETKSVKQYAALHDFCMTIPYGAVVALVGIAGLLMGLGGSAMGWTLAGIATCVSSALSLKAWRVGRNNSRYTLASAGLALGAGALSWRGRTTLTGQVILVLSTALVLFLIYNLGAGGNPPKRAH